MQDPGGDELKEIKAVSVKMPMSLYNQIKAIGQQEVRNLSQEIVYLLEKCLSSHEKDSS